MAKWAGKIGFVHTEETFPGVWAEIVEERLYGGDFLTNKTGWQAASDQVNDNVRINHQISIIADSYATMNLSMIRYVEFLGNKWKVTDISIEYPRLILSVGGVYSHGQQTKSA